MKYSLCPKCGGFKPHFVSVANCESCAHAKTEMTKWQIFGFVLFLVGGGVLAWVLWGVSPW